MLVPHHDGRCRRHLASVGQRPVQMRLAAFVESGLLEQPLDLLVVKHTATRRTRRSNGPVRQHIRIRLSVVEQPSQMRLQQLAGVHAREDTMRVQENVNCRRPAAGEFQLRHFLRRQHLGDDAFVAVAPHQLVSRLKGEGTRDAVLQPTHESRIAR